MVDTFAVAMRLMRKRDAQLREDGFATLRPIAADVLPVLARELRGRDESLRVWARRGLEMLNTKEARTILWREDTNRAG
jgi:hypothetical protein